jgi:SH3-like domain-containing protein
VSEEQPKQTNSSVPQKQTQTGVTVDYVNIRREPTYNSEKILNLKPNTRVEIVKENRTHYLIKAEEREGWVVKGFIKVQ